MRHRPRAYTTGPSCMTVHYMSNYSMSKMEAAMTPRTTARLLPLAAIGGSILFDVAWIVMGHLRPGYSPVGRPISALAVGSDGVFVRTAFLLYGALVTLGTVSALRSVKQELG